MYDRPMADSFHQMMLGNLFNEENAEMTMTVRAM
jgi:hypothetical protein